MSTEARSWTRPLVAVGCVLWASGCVRVAPYERARLANRTMAAGFGETRAQDHVRSVHEGATGGAIGVSSGCGCN
jgi:hypothetical protein